MTSLDALRTHFLAHLSSRFSDSKEPQNLYAPIQYILNLGGKRLRPLLTLMSCELFEVDYNKAMDAALAIELFHNFSLIHDDIMDQAPYRRGKETVHKKWNINTGILSGDAMLILAYQLFENYDPATFHQLAKLFSKTAIEVCEGQQYDIDFEIRDKVTIEEYLYMINYKTAVLVGAAMKMGAIVAGGSENSQFALYEFGRNLGIAFQLQDDYLDIFGDPLKFGKQVGGDIIANKKTYIYLTALSNCDANEQKELEHLYSIKPIQSIQKIETVTSLFLATGAANKTQEKIREYTQTAIQFLQDIEISNEGKKQLSLFAESLIYRMD